MGIVRRRARRRGLIVGAAVGSAAARRNRDQSADQYQEAPEPSADNQMDQMAELEKLGELKANGILTEEEFQAKKKQILGI